jgi:hypothetical protein
MAALKGKTTNRSLLSKGFAEAPGDHNYFEFWHEGIMVAKTKTSRNDQDIYDGLISAMSKQCKVSSGFFKEFAKCTRSKDDYINELTANGTIIPKEEK